jgi:hypothetical protein
MSCPTDILATSSTETLEHTRNRLIPEIRIGGTLIVTTVQIHRETAQKANELKGSKNVEKSIVRYLTPRILFPVTGMPNQPSPDKVVVSFRIPRTLKVRLEKAAATLKMNLSEFIEFVLFRETQNIELTPDDYRRIAQETDAAKKGRSTDQRLRDARAARKTREGG